MDTLNTALEDSAMVGATVLAPPKKKKTKKATKPSAASKVHEDHVLAANGGRIQKVGGIQKVGPNSQDLTSDSRQELCRLQGKKSTLGTCRDFFSYQGDQERCDCGNASYDPTKRHEHKETSRNLL
jgi:hypothetical protein